MGYIHMYVYMWMCFLHTAPPPTLLHSTIPPEELQDLSELFTSIDEEGTGTITYDQLRTSLDMAGCQVRVIDNIHDTPFSSLFIHYP